MFGSLASELSEVIVRVRLRQGPVVDLAQKAVAVVGYRQCIGARRRTSVE